jgi:hypothetical protein
MKSIDYLDIDSLKRIDADRIAQLTNRQMYRTDNLLDPWTDQWTTTKTKRHIELLSAAHS